MTNISFALSPFLQMYLPRSKVYCFMVKIHSFLTTFGNFSKYSTLFKDNSRKTFNGSSYPRIAYLPRSFRIG
jgi:hypothetical protein